MMYIYEIEMIETFYGMELEVTDYDGVIIGYAKTPDEAKSIIQTEATMNKINVYEVNHNY